MISDHHIQEFRDSVTPILLSEHDFIDWDSVDTSVVSAAGAANELEIVRNAGEISVESLARALGEHPYIYDVALSLVAFNTSGSQISKWGLGATVPSSLHGRQHLARQLLHIGLGKVLASNAPVIDLLRIAEVYKDSFRRRFRSGDRFGAEVEKIVEDAVKLAGDKLAQSLVIQTDALLDINLRRSLDYVIAVAGRSIVGISTVFQNQSGGRQQRDLSVTYPFLQQKLADYGITLVLIADGQGIAEASDRTLVQLFESVRYPMTLVQARGGALQEALIASTLQPAPETLDTAAVARLIAGALETRYMVNADELPLAKGPASLALARYAESNRNLGLELSSAGDSLSWSRPDLVRKAGNLAYIFNNPTALDLLSNCLKMRTDEVHAEGNVLWQKFSTLDSSPFGEFIVAASYGPGLTSDTRKIICRHALELVPGSAFAILLAEKDLNMAEIEAHRKRQAVLPVNIVIIGPYLIQQLARANDPVEVLNKVVLDQSDLTKVSPFVLSNATPTRMFFGRAAEAATILSTVSTNSVALLGSRRIGKTSLLRHVRQELSDANFLTFFGDCQTVRTWADFAALAETEWGATTVQNFRPQHLGGLVRALSAGSDKPVVILLDEVDQLLEWDQTHKEESVPEAFFRACRSLSQDGTVQFVFSGERTIAQRIWNPQSPHWNFCRPLALAQLPRNAASSLLIQPLKAIGVRIADETRFDSEAWRFTSGHPQIVQYLGDRLVRKLDARFNRRDLQLSAEDITAVAETYEYAEHYLNTYWGQANLLEREISWLVASAPISAGNILKELRGTSLALEVGSVEAALRMLQLYGIITEEHGVIQLRATWFNEAQSYFGRLQDQHQEKTN